MRCELVGLLSVVCVSLWQCVCPCVCLFGRVWVRVCVCMCVYMCVCGCVRVWVSPSRERTPEPEITLEDLNSISTSWRSVLRIALSVQCGVDFV